MSLVRLSVAVVALWMATLAFSYFALPDWATRGQFGDLFGAANALFSGLAFAGVFYALRLQQEQVALQRTELALQREELRLQREEMAATRGELEKQVRAQEALFRATAAQVTIAQFQARIEGLKISASEVNPGGRNLFVREINDLAILLGSLRDWVDTGGEGNNEESAA